MSQRKNFTPLILLLVLVAMYSYVAKPVSNDVQAMQAELDTLNAQMKEQTEKAGEARKLEITETDVILLENAVPQGFDQEFLIETINKISEDNLVRVNSISFNKTSAPETDVQTIQISLTGTTGKENFKNFLFDLENNQRTFVINNVGMSSNTIEELTKINFTINLESYFT